MSKTKQAVDVADDVPPQKKTSFVRFLIDVVIIGALLAGGVFFYNKHVTTKDEVAKLAVKALNKLKKDDFVSLQEAEKLYLQILELDGDNGRGLSGLAEVYFRQYVHGKDTLGKAKTYLDKAVAEEAETPSRYAVSAYVKIAEGRAADAEKEMRALLDQNIAAPRIAHAFGWALAEQGKFIEANRILRSAQDTDFSAVAIRLTLAEVAHRQGEERAAARHLSGVTAQNMNPNHQWARAWETALRLKNVGALTTPAKTLADLAKVEKDGKLTDKAKGYLRWAEGELALALLNIKGAEKKAEEALAVDSKFPPFMELQARTMSLARGKKKRKGAIPAYEAVVAAKPTFRGFKWALAELKSKKKQDAALALVDELEKTQLGTKGPEYEIFRGEHYLRKGDLEKAKAHFTKAADLGDDAKILFGLAKVTFEEEKRKGKKANMDNVSTAFTAVNEKRANYPELHEYLGDISVWNYVLDAAHGSYETAEKQFKTLKRPIPEVFKFYDRVVRSFSSVKERKIRKQAKKFAEQWKLKQQEYITSLLAAQS